jgi:hypothetical protein
VTRSDSTAADRLATRATDRRCPLPTARVRARRRRRLPHLTHRCVRYAAAFSRLPAALTLSTAILIGRRRTTVPPDAAVYAHELGCVAVHTPVRPRRAFLGRLPCAGEVTAAAQACRATARKLAPAELGQAVGRVCCAGRGRAGPGWAARVAPALCHWAAGGFGPVAFDYIFIFSEYIQFLANSKFCVGFI